MKRKVFALLTGGLLVCTLAGCEKKDAVMGTWQVVSAVHTDLDGGSSAMDYLITYGFGRLECSEGTIYSFDPSTDICTVSNEYSTVEYSYEVSDHEITLSNYDGTEMSLAYSADPSLKIWVVTQQATSGGTSSTEDYTISFVQMEE